MKGQIRVEFIFGVIVFAIVIFMVVSQINTIFISSGTDSLSDILKAKAVGFLDIVLKDSGDPDNWETNPLLMKRIGLSYNDQPFNLSLAKIQAIDSNRDSENRCYLLDSLDLGGYRLLIYKGENLILECGLETTTVTLVSVGRSVFIEDEYGSVILEVW